MTNKDKSYDLGISAACSDLYTGATIDKTKITLLGTPVIPGRHRTGIRFVIDNISFWEGYNEELKARGIYHEI